MSWIIKPFAKLRSIPHGMLLYYKTLVTLNQNLKPIRTEQSKNLPYELFYNTEKLPKPI